MGKLIYFMPTSLDGYIADDGNFDWSAPSEEAFAFITDLHRPIGTYLYGRKEYETMAVWETPEVIPGFTPAMLDFARIWQAADSLTLPLVNQGRACSLMKIFEEVVAISKRFPVCNINVSRNG